MTPRSLDKTAALPRPLFVYGTLRALPLLAWALTGDPQKTATVSKLTRKAVVQGYARYTVRGKDYPAVIKDENSHVDGLLFFPQNHSQRTKLDDFEGETYKVTPALVTVTDDSGHEEQISADIYLWNGDEDAISSEPWYLDIFIQERLDDWLDLFVGLELVGDDDEV